MKMEVKVLFGFILFVSLTRTGWTFCAFDLCGFIGDGCPAGKTCQMSDDCKNVLCVCDVTSASTDCENVTSTSTLPPSETPVTRTSNSSECLCMHGNCSTDQSGSCICESGWSGALCDEECSLDCDPGYMCKRMQGFELEMCVSVVETTTPLLSDTTFDLNYTNYNVCSDSYTPRPESERICDDGGFPCDKGVCRSNNSRRWCECDPGATGQLCHQRCCKPCQNGACFYHIGTTEEMCNCHVNYSGSFCEIWDPPKTAHYTQPEDPTWHYWVVGSCAFVLLLLICLMVVIPYFLWKHRVILVMKVVHYFQEYEDDDDREWDVFISYKSTEQDESFVVDTLFPKLEKELGFKAHVHFRDFMAGETISNNIISAVQGSRRTIMVISPSYVTSEFTKFEYQVAQQEMLKRKHRIIPILLEDISECKETMDPTLKIILGSVTYIEWPKTDAEKKKMDKFWKRIELSMPKKKNRKTDTESPVFNNINNINATTNPAIKPSDIPAKISNDKNTSKYTPTDANVYSSIDESKLNKEEVYDTLNETEMLTQVLKRQGQQQPEKMTNEEKLAHVLKIDV